MKTAYFFDSSSLVKRFARERGSAFVLSLLRPSAKNNFYAARIIEVEVCAALARREKAKTISPTKFDQSLRRFKRDLPRRFTQVAVSENIIVSATDLAVKYALRGYDAMQLAAVLAANQVRIASGLSSLILVSADNELNAAAQNEGLTIENPNTYP